MRVFERSKDIKYTVDVRREKEFILLNWLLEFKIVCREMVEDLLGCSTNIAYKILAEMDGEGLINQFSNVHTRGIRFYCLGKLGRDRLDLYGIDTKKAIIKSSNLARNTKVMHDISVQKVAFGLLRRIPCVEVFREYKFVDSRVVCDVVMVPRDGRIIVVEFDRTAKSEGEFYARQVELLKLIRNGDIASAFIASSSAQVLLRYEAYFDQKYWPLYIKNDKQKFVKGLDLFDPSDDERQSFTFVNAGGFLSNLFGDVGSSLISSEEAQIYQ